MSSREYKLAFREWCRTNDRARFLAIQKRGAYKDFYHLIDPAHEDYQKRFKGFRGGRSGGRTTTLARCLVDKMADSPIRVCAARSFQNSIAESNKQAIEQQIDLLNLNHRFDITEKYIEADNGSYCFFRGLERNTQNIKSLEGVDILWIEEAAPLTQKTIDIVEPTIRKKNSQIWFSWNPEGADNPVEKLPVIYSDRYALRHTNYLHNPWCPQSIIDGANDLKATDYERYLHVYEGAYWSASSASVFGKKVVSYNFEVDESYGTPMIGVDWGFSQDPTAVTECYVRGRTLFVRRAAAKIRLELDDTAAWLQAKVPHILQYASFADSARPETISLVKRAIPKMAGVEKWSGSVEDGVTFIQSFDEIVVHPECQPDAISELRAYSYKVDNNDNITSILVDANNHYSDSMRYALSPKIKRRGYKSFEFRV